MPPPAPKKTRRRGRGEGSIAQRADGLWRGRVSLGESGAGRRLTRDVYGRSKAEVMAKLDELRAQARSGTIPRASSLTVGDLLDRWLEATESKTATRTYEARESHVRVHLKPRIGGVKLSQLHALHVEGLYTNLAKAHIGKTAARSAATTLSIALNYAVRARLIVSNPATAIQKPTVPHREMLCLTETQAQALAAHCPATTSGALVLVALASGARQGELLALTWPDVDLVAGKIRIRKSLSFGNKGPAVKEPKTKSSNRDVLIPAAAVKSLQAHRHRMRDRLDKPVFCTATGGYLERRNVLRALRTIIRATNAATGAGIPPRLRFHDLRHSMASILLSRGRSLPAVSKRLGHANSAITLRVYAHCMPTDDAALSGELADILG